MFDYTLNTRSQEDDFYSYDNELCYESENGYLVPESFVEETV